MSARRFSTTLVILAAVTGAALGVGASRGSQFSAGRNRAPAGAGRAPLLPPSTRRSAYGKLCVRHGSGPLVYHWPVKPFTRQHPVRGNFGDPRTVGFEPIGTDGPGSAGSFTFHDGVDISAPPGTPVYPVESGFAHVLSADLVSVTTGTGRTFRYYHITPLVSPGQRVTVDRTVLGYVKPVVGHVHLSEIDSFRVHNPLDPGHLEPYRDRTLPTLHDLDFASSRFSPLTPDDLHGSVRMILEGDDLPAIPVPGHWFDFPVTPALVTWQLASGSRVIVRRTVADFRHTLPPQRDFWKVYAAGTYQNFPRFGFHFYWHRRGRYLFDLTPLPVNTRRLHNGTYRITVSAADTCGNRTTLVEFVRIVNRSTGASPAVSSGRRRSATAHS